MAKKLSGSQSNTAQAVFAEREIPFVEVIKNSGPSEVFADWLEGDIGDSDRTDEQKARAEFIRLQHLIEKTPLSDGDKLKACKKTEKKLLKQWGMLWAQKDLAASGLTPEQLEGIEPQWITFSHGFADLLTKPQLVDHVRSMHALIRENEQRGYSARNVLGDLSYNIDMVRGVGPEGQAAIQRLPENERKIFEKDFFNSGLIVKSLVRAGWEVSKSGYTENPLEIFLQGPLVANAADIRVMLQEGVDLTHPYMEADYENSRHLLILDGFAPELTGDFEYLGKTEVLKSMIALLREAGAKTYAETVADYAKMVAEQNSGRGRGGS